ncbi:MAG TPA: penicillin-binding protein 2 [Candidatus Paceibacterota bacterium]|nr:penicillin-binding protein 2 [Candidatus Paceibacterota bacterium]
MRQKFVLRVRVLSLFAIIIAIVLLTRLYFVQIVHGEDYAQAALGQYVEGSGEMPDRGEILFSTRTGETPKAATMQGGWRIAINPKLLQDPDDAFAKLENIVTLERERFFASAAKKDDPYEEVAFRLSDEEAAAVRSLQIQGVTTVREEWRLYPAGELAAHALGFVAFRGETKAGVYGLERYWEDTLRKDGGGLYVNPFAEIFTNVSALVSSDPSDHEGSIITSLEPNVQRQLENELEAVMERHSPRHAGGIVMDPQTGEILAIAVKPSYNPNTYNTVSDSSRFSNPLIEGVYEMGSIMKPLTMAAAIDVGAVSPRTTYTDNGCIKKTGFTLCNFDLRGRGVVDMQEVLSQSLNTGVSFAVDRMGTGRFAEYVEKYGLGEETGIDLPYEAAGNINALFVRGAADVDFASASFGQSIAVTPIAMIRALAALANEGKLPEPHIVRAIRYESGVERKLAHAEQTQVLKPETAATVTDMLVKVYDDALLDGELKQEHYSIAAKTGTAQIANPNGGGYYTDRYLHSFFGYFPAHDARFIVLLYALEPHGEMYASRTLARPFSDLAKFLINYYNIPPDR